MPRITEARVLIVATDGFEDWELFGPRQILQERGADVVLASLKLDPIHGTVHDDPSRTIRPDLTIDDARADDFDALVLPGGVRNPDQLRTHENVIRLIKAFARAGKPIGAICHAPWLLVEADVVRDLTITSWPSLQTDVRNAGGTWVDQEVVTEQGVVTSRKPDDIPAFSSKMIEEFAEGKHEGQREAARNSDSAPVRARQ